MVFYQNYWWISQLNIYLCLTFSDKRSKRIIVGLMMAYSKLTAVGDPYLE